MKSLKTLIFIIFFVDLSFFEFFQYIFFFSLGASEFEAKRLTLEITAIEFIRKNMAQISPREKYGGNYLNFFLFFLALRKDISFIDIKILFVGNKFFPFLQLRKDYNPRTVPIS
ncbi:hypothetical protein SSS_04938 [Sarcoptes scabiei]|nr:hypothetical protein SSS_04938 [Sarcoptes scabiei]